MTVNFRKLFFICSSIILLAIGACEEDAGNQYRVSVNEIIYGSDCKWQAVDGATVRLYATEQDYLLDENVVAEAVSDGVGRALFNVPRKTYWYSAYRGEYTHHRFAADMTYENILTETDLTAICILAPKPIQLQLQLKDQNLNSLGKDYVVTLFNTESDYVNNMKSLSAVYSFNCLRIVNFQNTSSEGTVLFPNLEAKEYWFKVEKGNQALETSIFKTPQLQNNPDIVNSLDVIVKL